MKLTSKTSYTVELTDEEINWLHDEIASVMKQTADNHLDFPQYDGPLIALKRLLWPVRNGL